MSPKDSEQLDIVSEFPVQNIVRRRRKKIHFDYEATDDPIIDPKMNFKVNFYFTIIDQTINSLKERFHQLEEYVDNFKVLYNFVDMSDQIIKEHCKDLYQKLYDNFRREADPTDLGDEFIAHKLHFLKKKKPLDVLNYIVSNSLVNILSNTAIALRILLTIPVSVASGERTFSKLKLIKNYLRSTMTQDRLSNPAMTAIEKNIAGQIDTKELVSTFGSAKARKAKF